MGRIAALLPSHGRPVRICTRSSYMMIDKHVTLHGWKGRVTWTTEAVSELSFFVQRGEEFDGSLLPQHFKDWLFARWTFLCQTRLMLRPRLSGWKAAKKVRWLPFPSMRLNLCRPVVKGNYLPCITSSELPIFKCTHIVVDRLDQRSGIYYKGQL